MGAKERVARPAAVLDTNVLVSALLFSGPAQRLTGLWQEGVISLLASAAMIREFSRVLTYPKFRLAEDEIAELLHEEVMPYIRPMTVTEVPAVIAEDPADDEILACAVAGRADAVVSGDKHLLRLGSHRGIPILSVRACLDRWT